MQLYKVHVETEILVIAQGADQARTVAKVNLANEVNGCVFKEELANKSNLPEDWEDVIPYSPSNYPQEIRKCGEIVKDIEAPKEEIKKEVEEVIEEKETITTTTGEVKLPVSPPSHPKLRFKI